MTARRSHRMEEEAEEEDDEAVDGPGVMMIPECGGLGRLCVRGGSGCRANIDRSARIDSFVQAYLYPLAAWGSGSRRLSRLLLEAHAHTRWCPHYRSLKCIVRLDAPQALEF